MDNVVNVESSFINQVGWEDGVLMVAMTSGTYYYQDVPEKVFNEIVVAESVGKYLNAYVKPIYSFERA